MVRARVGFRAMVVVSVWGRHYQIRMLLIIFMCCDSSKIVGNMMNWTQLAIILISNIYAIMR